MDRRMAAVVPAYNEAAHIGAVLDVLAQVPGLDTIVVVDDGSQDGTGAVVEPWLARDARFRLVTLAENRGKGAAMLAGVQGCAEETLLFVDADLIGLQPQHLRDLVRPVCEGQCDMAIGIFRAGRLSTDWAHRITPWLSGQRCLSRERFLAVVDVARTRMGVETALTLYAREHRWRVRQVPMRGVTHTTCEEKQGLRYGVVRRWRMYADIVRSWLQTRPSRGRRRRQRWPLGGVTG